MACEHDKTELLLDLYGEASETQRHELQARLNGCAECRAELEELQAGAGLLMALPQPELTVEAIQRLGQRLHRPRGRLARLAGRRAPAWLAPAVLAACLLAGAAAGLAPLLMRQKPQPEVPAEILAWASSMDLDLEHVANDIDQMISAWPEPAERPASDLDRQLESLSNQISLASTGALWDPGS